MESYYLPDNFEFLTTKLQNEIIEYISLMDEREKKAYLIAKEHLGSSFNIFRSNGYKEWKSKTL